MRIDITRVTTLVPVFWGSYNLYIKKVYNRRKYFVVVPCRKTEHGEKAEVWIFRIPDKDIPRVLPNLVIFH